MPAPARPVRRPSSCATLRPRRPILRGRKVDDWTLFRELAVDGDAERCSLLARIARGELIRGRAL